MPIPNEHIGQFKPGQSGNPNGRPEGVKNRSTIARKVLEMEGVLPSKVFDKLKEMYPSITKQMSVEEVMTIVMANKAITKQDTRAYTALMDSGYGKASQPLTGENGGPLQIATVEVVRTVKNEE